MTVLAKKHTIKIIRIKKIFNLNNDSLYLKIIYDGNKDFKQIQL